MNQIHIKKTKWVKGGKSETRQKMLTLYTSIEHDFGSHRQTNKASERERGREEGGKEGGRNKKPKSEVIMVLFGWSYIQKTLKTPSKFGGTNKDIWKS